MEYGGFWKTLRFNWLSPSGPSFWNLSYSSCTSACDTVQRSKELASSICMFSSAQENMQMELPRVWGNTNRVTKQKQKKSKDGSVWWMRAQVPWQIEKTWQWWIALYTRMDVTLYLVCIPDENWFTLISLCQLLEHVWGGEFPTLFVLVWANTSAIYSGRCIPHVLRRGVAATATCTLPRPILRTSLTASGRWSRIGLAFPSLVPRPVRVFGSGLGHERD